MKVYEASTLFDTMSTRKREYETLREQLLTLQKAFQSIVELDEALKGKGADAIKGFYQAQLDVLSLWLQLVDRNIAFFSEIPEGAAARNLENETVELPFLEDELSNSESRAREMVAEQQEDLQRIFDRISDIQPLQVFSRNKVDQHLDEAKVKREKTIESVEQFDEELTSKYTMLESDEQVLTALFNELMNASSQRNQVSSIYYDAASFHSSDIYSAIAASQAEAASVKKEQTSQEVKSTVEENENPFIESVNSFKEIGTDFWAGFQERGDKKMDSLYDFGNYLTSGLFDGVTGTVSAMDERSDKAMDSPYDFVNYLTSGGADLVKGAVNPEDDFSKEHWLSSFGLASMVAGAKVSVPKSGTAKMSNIKHTVHPDGTRKVMKETYQKVVRGPLINTRVDMKEIVRKVLDYKVPFRTKYSFAGVDDVSDFAVRDMLNDAKETLHFSSGKRKGSTEGSNKTITGTSGIKTLVKSGEQFTNGRKNRLKSHIRYITGEYDYIYETDNAGRIVSFATENLQLTSRTERLSHSKNTLGKVKGQDHAGHLAGDRFGGSPKIDNLVSQLSEVNLIQYKKIEEEWATALKEVPPKKVTTDVEIIYDGNDVRPQKFIVNYTIDGEWYFKIIKNTKE
ncbi:DNA/RNA non-specific endonuclease [Bacillus sp. NTK071]|uniref:T7SS effector LXG polymorphic toxin n=1 Tax=Bacillus sp. NTK071 TaxID=2802175 RepID=UPI001A8E27F5|nr:DNA/RNA non-specific endonuclease [Bacillus sp. NTK071]